MSQKGHRQSIQTMLPPVRIKDIGGKHGVEGHTLHLHAGPFKNDEVVLEVLAGLLHSRVRQHLHQRLHLRRKERRKVLRCARTPVVQGQFARPSMSQWDVVGLARFPGEGDSNEVGPSRGLTGGLGIDRDPPLLPDPTHQVSHFIGPFHQGVGDGDFVDLRRRRLSCLHLSRAREPIHQATKLELHEELPQPLPVGHLDLQSLEVQLDGDVGLYGDQSSG